jgi:hypothetical protein
MGSPIQTLFHGYMCFRGGILYLKSVPPKKPQNDKTPHHLERNDTIRRRVAAGAGEAVADLARAYGISVQRIHQILRA